MKKSILWSLALVSGFSVFSLVGCGSSTPNCPSGFVASGSSCVVSTAVTTACAANYTYQSSVAMCCPSTLGAPANATIASEEGCMASGTTSLTGSCTYYPGYVYQAAIGMCCPSTVAAPSNSTIGIEEGCQYATGTTGLTGYPYTGTTGLGGGCPAGCVAYPGYGCLMPVGGGYYTYCP